MLAGLLLVCILLSACTSIFTETTDEVLTPTPVPVEMIPQAGGDLFIAIPSEIPSFDPLTVTNEDLINFLTLIYETPFVFNDNGQLLNQLVESWDVSEDRITFTFHFRQDVFFSDGTQMTADDVEASAKRVLGMRSNAEPEPTQSEAPAWQSNLANRYASYNHDILSVEAIDEFTLQLTMTDSSNAGLYFMTFPVMKADFDAKDLPIGTGPYKVESYTEGDQALLTINELWWQDPPYIERIVANAVSSPSEKLEMLETSILDFITTNAINSGNYNVVEKWQVIDYMTDYYDCLVPNLRSRTLADIRVRQAISAAIDRRELLSTVLLNHGVPSSLPIAPDFFAVDAMYRSGQSNEAQALELLGQAGYRTSEAEDAPGRTLQVQLIVPDSLGSTYKREAARAIVKQLAEVCIEVEIEELSEEEYLKALEAGDFDLAYCSYYLSEVPNLAFMFDTNGTGNYGHVDDRELEEAIDACGKALTEEEIIAAYATLQERLSATLPQIGLYFRMNSIICDEGIHGIADVRQNAIFTTISRWFNVYFAQAVPETSSSVSAEPTPEIHQTEPDSIVVPGAVSASPSATPRPSPRPTAVVSAALPSASASRAPEDSDPPSGEETESPPPEPTSTPEDDNSEASSEATSVEGALSA